MKFSHDLLVIVNNFYLLCYCTMTTLDDVISYILTTADLSDIPTIMDVLTERVASEMWMVSEWSEPAEAELPEEEVVAEEEVVEEVPTEENLPPLSL